MNPPFVLHTSTLVFALLDQFSLFVIATPSNFLAVSRAPAFSIPEVDDAVLCRQEMLDHATCRRFRGRETKRNVKKGKEKLKFHVRKPTRAKTKTDDLGRR
jgi:hypothetical protein